MSKFGTLRTCAGVTETTVRRATGFIVESLDGATKVREETADSD